MACVLEISETRLQQSVNTIYQPTPKVLTVFKKTPPRLTIEGDEAGSFVKKRQNKPWVWLAMERTTREIVGLHVGARDALAAQALWDTLPFEYRNHAHCYIDFWGAYRDIFPEIQYTCCGKESGQTNPIERFNGTLWQRVSRLVRKTL